MPVPIKNQENEEDNCLFFELLPLRRGKFFIVFLLRRLEPSRGIELPSNTFKDDFVSDGNRVIDL